MRFTPRIAVVTVVLAGSMSTVAAAQMEARDRPRVRGPLVHVTKSCGRRSETAGGRVIATSRSCLRFYAFDPARERNRRRDYGVVWMQSNVDARRRWCAAEVVNRVTFEGRVRVLDKTPRGRRTGRAGGVRSRLVVNNFTNDPARISQRWRLYPRRLRSHVIGDDAGLEVVWRGSTRRELGFALGAELSWPETAGPPAVNSLLTFALRRDRSC